MITVVRKVFAIGVVRATTRDDGDDAPTSPLTTRQRTRSRSSSFKGSSTCQESTLQVTITSTPHDHAHDALIAATRFRRLPSTPGFVLKHTTIDQDPDDAQASGSELELSIAQDIPLSRCSIVFERVPGSTESGCSTSRLCEDREALVDTTEERLWRDDDDANVKFVQKLNCHTPTPECNTIITESDTMRLLYALCQHSGAVVWEPRVPGTPYIALTPADETWEEFTDRCSNQPLPQWPDCYLHAPVVVPIHSPYGPTDPHRDVTEDPITVFNPSRFAESVCLNLEQPPHQALFMQQHACKAAAFAAASAGQCVRAYYDNAIILERLDALAPFVWTDAAQPILAMWRHCMMVTIFESENPFAQVPHIVITGALPNAPWDVEEALIPEQDECYLSVPSWSYLEVIQAQREALDEAYEEWWGEEGEEEEYEANCEVDVAYCPAASFSESEDESEEARTPSPPSWPMHAFPSSLTSRLEAVCEEDESDAEEIPSATAALVRKPWLQDEDEEDTEEFSQFARRPAMRSARFSFSSTLSPIDEVSYEAAYQSTSAWTNGGESSACRSICSESGDETSVYTDALEEIPSESDADHSEDDHSSRRAQSVARPSCDIFSNGEESSDASPPPSQPFALSAELDDDSDSLPELDEEWILRARALAEAET
ncbi:hypothetical protein R3P38DRAFT_2831956 [Favolaschia claudopus]|uniref:Uncharacterized protein n=1 Tax=Favolaschia claudopus TaxID=2862362 RepID=A0AAW0ECK7_9AGAR